MPLMKRRWRNQEDVAGLPGSRCSSTSWRAWWRPAGDGGAVCCVKAPVFLHQPPHCLTHGSSRSHHLTTPPNPHQQPPPATWQSQPWNHRKTPSHPQDVQIIWSDANADISDYCLNHLTNSSKLQGFHFSTPNIWYYSFHIVFSFQLFPEQQSDRSEELQSFIYKIKWRDLEAWSH